MLASLNACLLSCMKECKRARSKPIVGEAARTCMLSCMKEGKLESKLACNYKGGPGIRSSQSFLHADIHAGKNA